MAEGSTYSAESVKAQVEQRRVNYFWARMIKMVNEGRPREVAVEIVRKELSTGRKEFA